LSQHWLLIHHQKPHQHFVARWLVHVKAAFCSMRLCLVNCTLAQLHPQNVHNL
jgi:hypothetical protein